MARPRKPTAVLELKGAFDKNPQRRRDPEPEPVGPVGEPPEGLTKGAVKVWGEITSTCSWLGDSDRLAVEIASVLMDKFRRDEISAAELATLRGVLGSLGMNPADRSKISVVKEKPKNQFAALAEESRSLLRVK